MFFKLNFLLCLGWLIFVKCMIKFVFNNVDFNFFFLVCWCILKIWWFVVDVKFVFKFFFIKFFVFVIIIFNVNFFYFIEVL